MTEEVRSIARRELGAVPDEVARVAEGLLHETYRISCDGETYVLQFSSDADESRVDSLRRGARCYDLLRDSEIPVPDVVAERPASDDGRRYLLVERIPGQTAERDITLNRVRNAGRYLAKIHEFRTFEESGWIRFENRRPNVRGFEEGGLAHRIRRTLTEDAAVLDFDRSYSGHAQRDLVKAASCFWMHDPCSDWNVRAKLYEGYRDVAEVGDDFEANEPLYRAETLVGTVAGLVRLNELSEYEAEFYSERILEAVERLEVT
ncbi:aminoglycoside phosphotransferase family protein (plasmid) [Halorussus limi]|uniref:Aminoglycoside phosphotransferase family protein n=1 Tax=Halorussus limi TaxID=2938695 RepID=A0A8U0HZU3_9EURY|nr:aminoglycoside phosphotransferase family protein [Halorussus limi]UPV76409.1 aminoglycoside phosphotransferase family protein [Halorussus limi]